MELLSSSSCSDGSGLSSAVLKDSVLDSVVVVLLDVLRGGRAGRSGTSWDRAPARGGVTSGVGGLRWLTGVLGLMCV